MTSGLLHALLSAACKAQTATMPQERLAKAVALETAAPATSRRLREWAVRVLVAAVLAGRQNETPPPGAPSGGGESGSGGGAGQATMRVSLKAWDNGPFYLDAYWPGFLVNNIPFPWGKMSLELTIKEVHP